MPLAGQSISPTSKCVHCRHVAAYAGAVTAARCSYVRAHKSTRADACCCCCCRTHTHTHAASMHQTCHACKAQWNTHTHTCMHTAHSCVCVFHALAQHMHCRQPPECSLPGAAAYLRKADHGHTNSCRCNRNRVPTNVHAFYHPTPLPSVRYSTPCTLSSIISRTHAFMQGKHSKHAAGPAQNTAEATQHGQTR